MFDDILDYIENIRERPVWQPVPDSVRSRFQAAVLAGPSDLAAVHDEFMRDILPFATGDVHPVFMGWGHGGGNVPGMLAEMLATGLNANLGGRDHMTIEVERQITHWLRQLFDFPNSASRLFVTGTSMANLLGVLIARARELGVKVGRDGVASIGKRLVAYTSAAAHG
jgi:aromatic-L-amino-acid decarboxylase